MEWGSWEECENGTRSRSMTITVAQVGAGRSCPELKVDVEECIHCEVAWEEWSICKNGKRSRNQIISVNPRGAGYPCPALQHESERKCYLYYEVQFFLCGYASMC